MAAVTSSGTATVTLPTDEQILITREFDAPKHLVYKAWTTPELVKRWWTAKRGEMTDRRDRPTGRRHVALRDGRRRRIRGRLPRRIPRDRPERADRLDRGLRGHAGRRETGAEHRHVHRGGRAHDPHDPRAGPEQRTATRTSTPAWRPACRTRWTSWRRSRSRFADRNGRLRATGTCSRRPVPVYAAWRRADGSGPPRPEQALEHPHVRRQAARGALRQAGCPGRGR